MKTTFLIMIAWCFFCLYKTETLCAQTILAMNGRSDFHVLVPANAPSSVRTAAREFLNTFQKSTGVRLPLVEGKNVQKNKPFISLGNTEHAREAGVRVDDLKEEGFCILLKNGNLFIAGKDTPDGQTTKDGGTSNGTANGVYTFLEDYLDARWLMPGEPGRTVARKDTLMLQSLNRSEEPLFVYRKLPYLDASWTMVNSSPPVLEWQQHQKLGYSVNLWHGHNWQETVSDSLYERHPEWFAMKDGKRQKPGFRYKLETTDRKLVEFFADRAIEELKRNKIPKTYSLSPSDSRGWSESPESKALYDPPPPGEKHPGTSSLVLKFYHDVAKEVHRKYPEGKLAGYLYDSYLCPPTKVEMKLPDNFIPVIAPSSITYGYRLYHEKNKRDWLYVMRSWANVAPDLWIYYDIPNAFNLWRMTEDYDRLTGSIGIVTPPAAEILNFIFSGMVENKIRGAYLFGTPTWSNTALTNYVMAKMLWNPGLDAYDVQRDWLYHAYGKEAGAEMEKFYLKLEGIYRDYSKDKVIVSRPNDAMFRDLYGKHYAVIEELFLNARSKTMNAEQQLRLGMIGDNLCVLQWRLRNAGFLPEQFSSPLTCTTMEINKLLQKRNDAFPCFPEVLIGWKNRNVEALKGETFLPSQDKDLLIVRAEKNENVRLFTRKVEHGTLFASCIVVRSNGERVYSGLLDKDHPITFRARKGAVYYLYFPTRPGTSFELDISGKIADAQTTGQGIAARKQDHPLYIYAPYQQQDAIMKAEQLTNTTVRIRKNNRLERTERLDPQD